MKSIELFKLFIFVLLPCFSASVLNSVTRLSPSGHICADSSSEVLDCVVIGCGLSGASAAFYLDKAGLNIRVAEATDSVGGIVATNAGIFGNTFSCFI